MGVTFEFPDGATPINGDEAAGLIPALSTQAELNEFELINIADAVRWAIKSRLIKASLLDEGTLRLLHQRMFAITWKWAGKYRLTQKSIGIEAYRIPSELRQLCDDVKCWLEFDSYPPDEIVARFHHRLVLIHPFANGNGRHARLAADLLCRNQRWDLPTWGSGDLVSSNTTRATYIDALRQADKNDIAPLVRFLRT